MHQSLFRLQEIVLVIGKIFIELSKRQCKITIFNHTGPGPMPPKSGVGYVYLMTCDALFKISFTKDID